jgi:hypothetical protein
MPTQECPKHNYQPSQGLGSTTKGDIVIALSEEGGGANKE